MGGGAGNAIVFYQSTTSVNAHPEFNSPSFYAVGGNYSAPQAYADIDGDATKDILTQDIILFFPEIMEKILLVYHISLKTLRFLAINKALS